MTDDLNNFNSEYGVEFKRLCEELKTSSLETLETELLVLESVTSYTYSLVREYEKFLKEAEIVRKRMLDEIKLRKSGTTFNDIKNQIKNLPEKEAK